MSDLEQRIKEAAKKATKREGWPNYQDANDWVNVASPANILALLAEKDAEIERLTRQVSDIHRAYQQEVRDAARDARDSAAEAYWQGRQGEEYGSY